MRNTGCGGRDFFLPHTELPPEASFPADGKATELPSDMQHTAKRYATRCQAICSILLSDKQQAFYRKVRSRHIYLYINV